MKRGVAGQVEAAFRRAYTVRGKLSINKARWTGWREIDFSPRPFLSCLQCGIAFGSGREVYSVSNQAAFLPSRSHKCYSSREDRVHNGGDWGGWMDARRYHRTNEDYKLRIHPSHGNFESKKWDHNCHVGFPGFTFSGFSSDLTRATRYWYGTVCFRRRRGVSCGESVTAPFSLVAILLLAFTTAGAAQPKAPDCFRGEVHVEPRRIGDFLIQLDSVPDKKDPRSALCRVQVLSSHGPMFQAADRTMTMDEISGKDVNGDGQPDAVLVGYSGGAAAPEAGAGAQGAHCCWTYWVVSLGHPLGLLKELSNQTTIGFRETADGHIDLQAGDGAFDYFDCLSHAETVFPTVFLRLQGRELKDVGPEHWDDYANQIAQARRRITAEELRHFRESKDQDEMCEGNSRPTIPKVLTIVFADLYGGREQEAWKALDEMWPPTDKDRIRKLMLQKRAEGMLRYTKPASPRKKR